MKINSLSIKNFRTFNNAGISMSFKDLTALIGENSTGKSNVLESLDLFFNYSKSKVSKRCFHHDDITKPIYTEINFTDLTDSEKKKFRIHLSENNSLTITQKIKLKLAEGQEIGDLSEEDYEFEEGKHGTKWQAINDWANLGPKPPTMANIKKWWKNELVEGEIDFKSFFDDPSTLPSPSLYQEKLEEFWFVHFKEIKKEKLPGDDKILGWKNILKGNLPKFFYVPAVKDVSDDLKVLKSNPFGEMINWLTKNITDDLRRDIETKAGQIAEEALCQIDKDENGNSKLAFLNTQLNQNLGVNLDCKLELKFSSPSFSEIVLPSPKIFADDGYYSEIDLKGQCIQRLCIFSLLKTYNELKRRTEHFSGNIIIGLEEPEIYLHPPVKRSLYKSLRELSSNKDQIIYTTHDSYFVSVENFDEIRLFRKPTTEKPSTTIHEFSYEKLSEFYQHRFKIKIDEKSLRHRFGHICDESKNEGFFANKVVIIEGETEKYSLPIYFSYKNYDLDEKRVALIAAGSVDNIDYLYVVFNEFNIPCYVIFDGDKPDCNFKDLKGKEKENALSKSKRNKELFHFLKAHIGEDVDYFFPETSITPKYAVWEKDFESTFHHSIDKYEEIKSASTKFYGTKSKPLAGRFFADELTSNHPDLINPYIDELISNITECCWDGTCLLKDE